MSGKEMFVVFSNDHGAALEWLQPGAAVRVAEPLHRLPLSGGETALLCINMMH